MVALHRSDFRPRQRAARSIRRPVARLALVACASGFLLGCQQSGRFAEGVAASPAEPYSRQTPADEIAPPSVHVGKIPPAPTAPVKGGVAFNSALPTGLSPRVKERPWRWIVVHHSATPGGGAVEFDKLHRETNGWDELGYHFVIGNGTNTRDGQVEVGPRWAKQKHGAHAKTDDNRFNDYGIGICLVGDFDRGRPTARQMQALAALTANLMQRYAIPAGRVIGHDDTGKNTACPGHNLEAQLPAIRRLAARTVATNLAAGRRDDAATYASERR